jgi:hypothetical protein
MTEVFHELHCELRSGGRLAFEVGEVRGGKIKLEEDALLYGVEAGFNALLVLINGQTFTKTANCWGADNNSKGTNTNRVVVSGSLERVPKVHRESQLQKRPPQQRLVESEAWVGIDRVASSRSHSKSISYGIADSLTITELD